MTIASKLFRVSAGSAVYELVRSLEDAAMERGYTLSRWQSNKGSHVTTITYAIHSGERASQFRYQTEDSIVASALLLIQEGSTERCPAYPALRRMESEFDRHMRQEAL